MADATLAAEAYVRNHLEQIYLHLQLVQAGILVSANALRHQSCEYDEEVACTLVHSVNERLAVQMEHIAEIIEQLRLRDLGPDALDKAKTD